MPGWIHTAAAAAAVLCASSALAQDCGRPKSVTERLICSNDRLGHAQNKFAFAYFLHYRRATTDERREEIRREQREWEANVRDACTDIPCLMKVFGDRTLELEQN